MTDHLISPQISISQLNQLSVLRIQNSKASATIALQGAHVLEYTPTNGKNLLFVSQAEPFNAGEAIRGGIPICWPWFGAHAQDDNAPAHGFVRDSEWEYTVVADQDDRTDIKFFRSTTGTELGFPHKASVELLVSIGDTLVVSLTTTNLDHKPFLISQALHTYFNCDNIEDVRLHGLTGACYLDKLTSENKYIPTEFRFNQEVDWIVQEPGDAIGLSGLGYGAIKMNRMGSRSVILWNPWIDKAKSLSHFQPQEYQKMFCVETANASEDSRLLKPKQTHSMLMELSTLVQNEAR